MYKYNIRQRENTHQTLFWNFALSIHENPTIFVLVAFFKKDIDLAIWENIKVLNIKALDIV